MIHKVSESDFVLQTLSRSIVGEYRSDHYLLLVKANWCPHCVSYIPTYETISAQNPRITCLVLESTENETMMKRWSDLVHPAFEVNGFPTLVLYDDKGAPVKIIKDRFNPTSEI